MTGANDQAFYCSSSGTYFTNANALRAHYKTDLHRYNLTRQAAGLPPVTQEWYEARKAQLVSTRGGLTSQRLWTDPLTKRKFSSENTYHAFIRSKKYVSLLKAHSMQQPPEPVISLRKTEVSSSKRTGTVGALPVAQLANQEGMRQQQSADDASSGWETASDEGEEVWEEWDVRRSLFDNHVSASMEANLEYMYKTFGFYLPDAEYLSNPTGLLQYLGQKLQYGHVPLYQCGDDPNSHQFRSLHAVQRHMIDAGKCKMLYDGNEDEYADFYDYPQHATDRTEHDGASTALLAELPPATVASSGYELLVPSADGQAASKVLGSREFAMYYKQRPRPEDSRTCITATALVTQYARLGISTKHKSDVVDGQRGRKALVLQNKLQLQGQMKNAVIRDLPKNCMW